MGKKYLRKNEFRYDINPEHFGRSNRAHPTWITAKYKHMYKANSITHARKTTDGLDTKYIGENPDKLSKDKRPTRVSPPFWQNIKQFSDEKLTNFKFSRESQRKISKFNRKFK